MFKNIYEGKKIILTGHTGFKGSWMLKWLLNLGANVVGISNNIPTNPSMFEVLRLEKKVKHFAVDIRNFDDLSKIILNEKPDFIFHFAAQAIVSYSYDDPLETISTNVIGTTNLLEALRVINNECTTIIITSDKVYDNIEQIWGYKEDDQIGGKDIYSGSKGAAELVIKSYFHSFFKLDRSNVRLAVARAGNVVGGGDWAKDRIIVDAISAWSRGEQVEIRSPKATRPWQHVLEPLSGYLNLGMKLFENKVFNGECFNFGPVTKDDKTVISLLNDLSTYWVSEKNSPNILINEKKNFYEATLLKLNCEKALASLDWYSVLNYEDTIRFISEWYVSFYKQNTDMNELTNNQILDYQNIAKSKSLKWTV